MAGALSNGMKASGGGALKAGAPIPVMMGAMPAMRYALNRDDSAAKRIAEKSGLKEDNIKKILPAQTGGTILGSSGKLGG